MSRNRAGCRCLRRAASCAPARILWRAGRPVPARSASTRNRPRTGAASREARRSCRVMSGSRKRPESGWMGCRWRAARSIRPAWSPAERRHRPEGPRRAGPGTGVSSGVIPLGQRACGDKLPATEVAARDAAADAGKDLVVDRPTRGGEVVGALLRARLCADEDDLVALARAFDRGDIEHDEVHADAPGEADAMSAHEDPTALSGH